MQRNVSRILKEESSLKEERQRILDGSSESEAVISEKLAKIEQLGRQILEETSKAQRLEEALAQNSEEKERLAEKQKSFFRKREELSEEIWPSGQRAVPSGEPEGTADRADERSDLLHVGGI